MAGKRLESGSLHNNPLEENVDEPDSAFIINKKFQGIRKKVRDNDISMSENIESPKTIPFVNEEFVIGTPNISEPHSFPSKFQTHASVLSNPTG